jgi:hypothetical protein
MKVWHQDVYALAPKSSKLAGAVVPITSSSCSAAGPMSSSSSSAAPAAPASAAPDISVTAVKKEVADERKRAMQACQNTMHVCARYLADMDLIEMSRIDLMCTEPLAIEHARGHEQLRCEDGVITYYAEAARGLN